MAEQTKAGIAFLYITLGPASEFIRFGGKIITENFIELDSINKLVIGRNPELANLQIYDLVDESSISRIHCSIYFDAAQNCFMLSDENSSNGTYLNHERIGAKEAKQLRNGDEIEVGRIWKKGIQFTFAAEKSASADTYKRVVLHSEDKSISIGQQMPEFPHLDALLNEKRQADQAQKPNVEITANLYDAIMMLDETQEAGVDTATETVEALSEEERASLKQAADMAAKAASDEDSVNKQDKQ